MPAQRNSPRRPFGSRRRRTFRKSGLLSYAGLGTLDLDIVEFFNERNPGDTWHVAGFFQGIEAGVCRFGVNVPLLGDPEASGSTHAAARTARHP